MAKKKKKIEIEEESWQEPPYYGYVLRADKSKKVMTIERYEYPNFKEVKVKGNELASLPKGSVIVYDAFEPYVNKNGEHKKIGQDGHVTVALGNGKACSDVMEDEIVTTDKAYVFIPV